MATIVTTAGSTVAAPPAVYTSVAQVTAALVGGTLSAAEAAEVIGRLIDNAERAARASSAGRPVSGPCKISRSRFLAAAEPMALVVDGRPFTAKPTRKSAEAGNSLGYWAGGQTTVMVDGVACAATVNVNITLNKSDAV